MIYYSHLTTAVQLLRDYSGEQPFDIYVKDFFRQNKKYGSKDRKNILQLCYACLRMGKTTAGVSIEENIKTGLFLCSTAPNSLLEFLTSEWNEKAALPFQEKLAIVGLPSANGFPWKDELSEGMDFEKFNHSFFIQPDLFLRLRPGKEVQVKEKLAAAEIPFTEIDPGCLALPNASKISEVITVNREAVIQDYNSQQTGKLLQSQLSTFNFKIESVWDCCAASGGKSLMVVDLLRDISLTVSDKRQSILGNLVERFAEAGIKNYDAFVANLTRPLRISEPRTYDLIIADVPCSGSGTWSRTPEQLAFFDEKEIERFSALQKTIIDNIIPQLKKGGLLLYITCSVFKKENEEVVQYIMENFTLKLQEMKLLKGYEKKADTLFAALFTA